MFRPHAACIVLALAASAAAAPPTTPDWPYDVLKLKNGGVHKGLLLTESTEGVRFQIVGRGPGKPTRLWTVFFAKAEVAAVDKLPDDRRDELKAKLRELDESPEAEAKRLERIDLKPAEWMGKSGAGLRYESEHFSLLSDAPEQVVRRAAHRLETVYTAYGRFLPPRHPGGPPTTIVIHQTLEGYRKSTPNGEQLRNPAFFDPAANRIVCGTDLHKLGEDLARFHSDARQQLEDLAAQEAKIIKLYGKKPELARHLQPIKEIRGRIGVLSKTNDEAFDRSTRQLFQTLYHEAFHAYLGSFVFPAKGGPGELPRWLNEGMAQVFETAVFEAGELRIGHADRTRLGKAQDHLAAKDFPALKDVVGAGRESFVVTHDGRRPDTDRMYLATWAVASYLMFDRGVLGSEGLNAYVKATQAGGDPIAAFEQMVGQPLFDFEKALHAWLKRLQPNGELMRLGK